MIILVFALNFLYPVWRALWLKNIMDGERTMTTTRPIRTKRTMTTTWELESWCLFSSLRQLHSISVTSVVRFLHQGQARNSPAILKSLMYEVTSRWQWLVNRRLAVRDISISGYRYRALWLVEIKTKTKQICPRATGDEQKWNKFSIAATCNAAIGRNKIK